jgi:hypothetical protein
VVSPASAGDPQQDTQGALLSDQIVKARLEGLRVQLVEEGGRIGAVDHDPI